MNFYLLGKTPDPSIDKSTLFFSTFFSKANVQFFVFFKKNKRAKLFFMGFFSKKTTQRKKNFKKKQSRLLLFSNFFFENKRIN
jgi:hypothetical protein